MIPCSGYFRVERGYEIEKSIFNLIIGKSEGIDIEFRIVNPAKRNVMVVKNEMRLLKQKRNVLQI